METVNQKSFPAHRPHQGLLRAVKGDQPMSQRESPSLGFPKGFSALQSPSTGAPAQVNALECHAQHVHAPAACQVLSSRGVTQRMDRGSRNPTAVTITGLGALGCPVLGPAVPHGAAHAGVPTPRHAPPEAHQQLSLDESRSQPQAEGNGCFERRLRAFWK